MEIAFHAMLRVVEIALLTDWSALPVQVLFWMLINRPVWQPVPQDDIKMLLPAIGALQDVLHVLAWVYVLHVTKISYSREPFALSKILDTLKL